MTEQKHWQVENLRVTLFFAPEQPLDPSGWWKSVAGDEPESRQSSPRTGEIREEGDFEPGRLTLSVQPGRVDWFLNPIPGPGASSFPVLGNLETAATAFLSGIERWLLQAEGEWSRVALGAVLLMEVESVEKGYDRLNDFLPNVRVESTGSSDFLYQINRPRDSARFAGVRINRLSRWSVARFRALHIGPLGVESPSQSVHLGEGSAACRLEVDINTLPNADLPKEAREVVDLLAEMRELADEISHRGDTP